MNRFSVVGWLGRKDSNLGMRRSKPRALPLGDDPILVLCKLKNGVKQIEVIYYNF